MIAFRGTYDAPLLRRTDRATRRLLGRSTVDASGGHLAALAVVLVLGPLFAALAGAPKSILNWVPIGALCAVVATINSWGISRAIANSELLGQTIEGELTPDGITLKTPSRELTARWAALTDYRASSDFILLAGSVEGAVGLPREFFLSPEQYAAAVSLVRQNVIPRRTLVRWRRWFRFAATILVLLVVFFLWALFAMR